MSGCNRVCRTSSALPSSTIQHTVAMSPTVVSKCCNSRKLYTRYSFQCDIIFHSRTFARFRRKKCHSTLARSLDLAQTQSPRQRVLQRCNITSAQSKASTTDRQVSISEYQHVEDGVLIRPAQLSELEDVAWLRAEAYYEVRKSSHHQLIGSFQYSVDPLHIPV